MARVAIDGWVVPGASTLETGFAAIDMQAAYWRGSSMVSSARDGTSRWAMRAISDSSAERAPSAVGHECVLLNGKRVIIRRIRRDDRGLVRAFVAGLSDHARHFRFKKGFHEATGSMLDFLTEVDQKRHVALIAVALDGEHEEEIGEARFVTSTDGTMCEFAVVVADAWQRKGIAGRLMGALESVARQRGIAKIEGFVLSSNTKMLRFVRARGFTTETDPHDVTVTRVVKALDIES